MIEILIYGIVGDCWDGLDANTIVPLISGSEDDIEVRINSAGGYVMEGLTIFNALVRAQQNGRKVTTFIDGLAASMASVIAMAGEERIMADNALMMIHNPWDVAMGDAAELRRAADKLDIIRDQLIKVYSQKTGIGDAELQTMLDAETWFTSEQALEQKFVTSVTEAVSAAACDVSAFGFRKAPDSPHLVPSTAAVIQSIVTGGAVKGISTAVAAIFKPNQREAAVPAPQPKETIMDLYKTRAALVAAIAKFQKDGGTQDEIDRIAASAASLDALDALPATGALAPASAPAAPAPGAEASAIALTAADVQAAAATAVAAERTRIATIRAECAKHKLPDDFTNALITDNVSVEQARAKILDKLAERSDSARIGLNASFIPNGDERKKWIDGASNWLLVRAGVAQIVQAAAKASGQAIVIDPGEFRGVSCVQLAQEALAMAGVRMQSRDPNVIVGQAMTARNEITQTTGDFSVLLENVMHKTLQAAYATAPDTWRMFCGTGTVTDFRDHNQYLRGSFGALDSLNEAGEFKNKPIPDGAREKMRASTKGNIVNLSRQALINDDLAVFSDIAVDLGRAAKLTIEVDVYALLNSNPNMGDGVALFHASHGNLAGAGAAPSVAAFDAARVAIASQKDVSGNDFLDIRPDIWLGPIGIGSTTRVIIGSPYDPDAPNKLQRPNAVANLFKTIVDTPRLTGTAWYVFADKDSAPAIKVVFLNGIEEPFLDNELGWRVDGTEWKVRLDYGVGAVNYRSTYKNPGA